MREYNPITLEDVGRLEEICGAENVLTGAALLLEACTAEDNERFWRIRKQIPWTLKRRTSHQSVEDIVVPVAAIPELVESIKAALDPRGILNPGKIFD